jgi:hypothetical protein
MTDAREAYLRTMLRYPKTMARLGDYDPQSLRDFYNATAREPVPQDMLDLLARLK